MRLRTYEEAESFLNGFVNYEKLLSGPLRYDTSEFDRDTFRRLLRRLGDPHLDYAVIHVAGTKGKGSTCAFLEAILRAAGIRTGLYTSPHICRYTERIAVHGQPIPDDRFCALLTRLSEQQEEDRELRAEGLRGRGEESGSASGSPGFRTVFELLTAAAFLHFSDEKVQAAIVETGLGGRLDSTNVFDQPGAGPLINVITPIAFDHTAVLGDTIEKIASEKAGILHAHGTTVLAPQPASWAARVRAVVEARLHSLDVHDYLDAEKLIHWRQIPPFAFDDVHRAMSDEVDADGNGKRSGASFTFDEHGWRRHLRAAPSHLLDDLLHHQPLVLHPALPGAHQLDNLRTVLCTLAALDRAGTTSVTRHSASGVMETALQSRYEIEAKHIRQGAAAARWPGRFEVLSSEPLVIIDGAHCPLSAKALADTFTSLYGPEREVVLVAGFLRDKPAEEILSALKGRLRVAQLIACTPPTPRARSAEETALAARATLAVPATEVPDVSGAVREALDRRRGDQAVVIFGSMYLIGPAGAAVRA